MNLTDHIKTLHISQETKDVLIKNGFTNIYMILPQDENRFSKELTRDQFIELCSELSKIRSGIYWDGVNKKDKTLPENRI